MSKATKPKLNVKLLREIQRQILLEPLRFDMPQFFQPSEGAPCNTAACIGGWALVLNKQKNITPKTLPKFHRLYRRGGMVDAWFDAAKVLGLGPDTSDNGYLPTTVMKHKQWPNPYHDAYQMAQERGDRQLQAIVAVARIEHLINFGE